MFWNRKKSGETATAEIRPPKKVSPKALVAQQLEGIEAGKELTYKLADMYVKPFITVTRNSAYPGSGKKLIVYQEGKEADGTPSGNRARFWETNNSTEVAGWILDREGKLYT